MSDKKGTIKETVLNALDLKKAASKVSIDKDVWEKFVIEVQSRTHLNVHCVADGTHITEIELQ